MEESPDETAGGISSGSCPNNLEPLAWASALTRADTEFDIRLHKLPLEYMPQPGWITPSKKPSAHLLLGVLSGRLETVVAGEPLRARPGDILWICPGTVFSCARTGSKALRLLRIHVGIRHGDPPGPAAPSWPYAWIRKAPELFGPLRALADHAFESTPLLFPESTPGEILSRISAAAVAAVEKASETHEVARLLPKHREHLRAVALRDRGGPLSPSRLAEMVGLSPKYFTAVFTRTFGKPPRRWLLEERLREAARLLVETDLPLPEIAGRFGYTAPESFSRRFHALFGQTPRHFRLEPPQGI